MDIAEQQSLKLQQEISNRIRKLRMGINYSLDKLAEVTGFSKSYLSQIENCEKNPPIGTLTKIAFGLGVDVFYLITGEHRKTDDHPKFSIVRQGERRAVTNLAAPFGYIYESICYNKSDRLMDAYVITMNSEIPKEPLVHEGQEIAFALEGSYKFYYDGKWTDVEPGDCLYYDSNRPHFSCAAEGQKARVLVIFSAPRKY